MATPVQRVQAILDALKDAPVPQAELDRVLDAVAAKNPRLLPDGATPATATRPQKARAFLRAQRRQVLGLTRTHAVRTDVAEARRLARERAGGEVDLGSDD